MGALHVEEIPNDTKQNENWVCHLFLTFKDKNMHTRRKRYLVISKAWVECEYFTKKNLDGFFIREKKKRLGKYWLVRSIEN